MPIYIYYNIWYVLTSYYTSMDFRLMILQVLNIWVMRWKIS